MNEYLTFSVNRGRACRLLPAELREPEDVHHRITVKVGSEQYAHVARLYQQYGREWLEDNGLLCANFTERQYTSSEIAQAELFHMGDIPGKMPCLASDESGYDFSAICPHCRAGQRQVGPLRVKLRRLPKKKPLVILGTQEWLVPLHIAEALTEQGFTGFALKEAQNDENAPSDQPVRVRVSDLPRYAAGRELIRKAQLQGIPLDSPELTLFESGLWVKCLEEHKEWLQAQAQKPKRACKPMRAWYQLVVTSPRIRTIPPTRFGIDHFNEDAEGTYRCPLGHRSGVVVLSEVYVRRSDWDGSDVVATAELIGLPILKPMVLVTPRFRQFWIEQKVRGVFFNVAHLGSCQ